jgi:hypothetical protein
MATNAIGDIIRVTAKLEYSTGNDAQQNVFHGMIIGGSVSDEDLHAAVTAHLDDMYGAIVTHIPNDTDFVAIETWNLTQDRPIYETGWDSLTGGTSSADSYASQTAPLVLLNTQAPRSQGRKFLPSFTETDIVDGKVSPTAVSNITTFAGYILSEILGDTWGMSFGNWNKTLSRFAPYIGAIVSDILATQRRRRRGRGT